MHLLNSGDHVISIDDVYGGTQRYFRRMCNPVRAVGTVEAGAAGRRG